MNLKKLFPYLYYHLFFKKKEFWANIQITFFFMFYISLTLLNYQRNIYFFELQSSSVAPFPLSYIFYNEKVSRYFNPRANFISGFNLDNILFYFAQFAILTDNEFNYSIKSRYAVLFSLIIEFIDEVFSSCLGFFFYEINNIPGTPSLTYSYEVKVFIASSFYLTTHLIILFYAYMLFCLYKNRVPRVPWPLTIITKSIMLSLGLR